MNVQHVEDDPLLSACQDGYISRVKALLQNPTVDINVLKYSSGSTPLMLACQNNHFEIVELLLQSPRLHDINMRNDFGETAALLTCKEGGIEILKLLMNCEDIDFNKASNDGWTPLMHGCLNGSIEIVECILSNHKEINIEAKDKGSWKAALVYTNERLNLGRFAWENEESFNERKKKYLRILELLNSYKTSSDQTRIMLRKKLGFLGKLFISFLFHFRFFFQLIHTSHFFHEYSLHIIIDSDAADLFSLIVLFSDEYLEINET